VKSHSLVGSEETVLLEVEPFLRSYRRDWSPSKAAVSPHSQIKLKISDSHYSYWFHHTRPDPMK